MGIFSELVAANRKFLDKSELPRALATAGLLTASGWDWSGPFDAALARRTLRSRRHDTKPWVAPPPEAFDTIAGRRAELAGILQESLDPTGSALIRRLLLLPAQPHGHVTRGDLDELRVAAGIIAGGREFGTTAIIDPRIAGRARKWHWPLRLSVEGLSVGQLRLDVHGVERGLIEPQEFGAPVDLAIARTPGGIADADANMILLLPMASGSEPAPVGELIGLAPSLAVAQAPLHIGEVATRFVYEMSHNFTPDQALNLAATPAAGYPPLLLAGDGFVRDMEDARLSVQLDGIVDRIERLGKIDDTPFIVPSNADKAFEIHLPSQATPRILANALRQAIGAGRVHYDHEDDAGEATAEIAQQVAQREQKLRLLAELDDTFFANFEVKRDPDAKDALESLDASATIEGRDERPKESETENPLPPERDRFTDVAILAGHYFAGEEARDEDRLDSKAKLSPGKDYSLEIAVRAEPLGVEVKSEHPTVRPPRRDLETITIYAAVRALDPGRIELEDSLLPIDWPFDQDSSPAFFRFQPLTGIGEGDQFEIRLLSEDLRLLDHLHLAFEGGRWHLVPIGIDDPVASPSAEPAEEALLLHVVEASNGYGLDVILKAKDRPPLEIPLGRVYRQADIADLLNDVRRHWTALVIGKMAARTKLSEPGFKEETAALAGLGREAWRRLFGDRSGIHAGTGEALARLLSSRPIARDSPVRISYARNAEDFIFPWSIVTPPPADGEPAEPRFWGLDFQIMLTRKEGRKPPPPASGTPRLCALVDKNFSAFGDHAVTLARVAKENGDAPLAFVSTEEELGSALSDANPSDIFYFYCQGLVGTSGALAIDVAAEIEKATGDLNAAQREPWLRLLDRLKVQQSGARIFADRIEISEQRLRDMKFFAGAHRPFVFLNMCHSAGMIPGSRGGFPSVFLERAASAVVGTEAPVTAQFADLFADRLLSALLRGETFGRAMLDVRRSFHGERNPLALLYTLYGRGDARLAEPSGSVASNINRERQNEID